MTQRKAKTRSAIDAMAEAAAPTIDEQIEVVEDMYEGVETSNRESDAVVQDAGAIWDMRRLRAAIETLKRVKQVRSP